MLAKELPVPRLPYLDRADLSPEVAALWDRRPLNLYRIIAHARTAAPGFLALGRALLTESELDPKLRELVILRVGAISHASYEIYQHKRLARSVGLSDDEIAAAIRERSAFVDGDYAGMLKAGDQTRFSLHGNIEYF